MTKTGNELGEARLDKMEVELPPALAQYRSIPSTDALLKELNEMPFFMRELSAATQAGDNEAYEALKALAEEGSPEERARNYKHYGNERFKEGLWKDAVEFYTRSLALDSGVLVNEQCYANRAACHLKLENYGRAVVDASKCLKLNPKNSKAIYRMGTGLFKLDKLKEAESCAKIGLSLDSLSTDFQSLETLVRKRMRKLEEDQKARQQRVKAKARSKTTLQQAMAMRAIVCEGTDRPPDMQDLSIALEKPADPTSLLSFPAVLLYPLQAQSDLIRSFPENTTIQSQLDEVLSMPAPWDEAREYVPQNVSVFLETSKHGLYKIGKKSTLLQALQKQDVVIQDSLIRLLIVPNDKMQSWIEEWKRKHPIHGR
jgi:tetratricopeptide (TPR) repeat protein